MVATMPAIRIHSFGVRAFWTRRSREVVTAVPTVVIAHLLAASADQHRPSQLTLAIASWVRKWPGGSKELRPIPGWTCHLARMHRQSSGGPSAGSDLASPASQAELENPFFTVDLVYLDSGLPKSELLDDRARGRVVG